jgi:hypothetical protein
MRKENLHPTDEHLLLHASAELSDSSTRDVRAHLNSCDGCRHRLHELESALANFDEAQREECNREVPPADTARTLLKARLAAAAGKRENSWLHSLRLAVSGHEAKVFAGTAVVVVVLLILIRVHGPARDQPIVAASLGHWDRPDIRLTPGVTVPVTANEVCGKGTERPVPAVPVSLKRKVFEEYGVTPPQPDAYEVDYLITPELGGATDIRNLWPEPYQDIEWNAHVKDQLEDRLHVMVCRGDLDLATAQHDISTDWIAAYRKYFHADKPVANSSLPQLYSLRRSLPHTYFTN